MMKAGVQMDNLGTTCRLEPEPAVVAVDDRIARLWARYAEKRDGEIRNELLVHYIPLVKRVVGRLFASSRPYVDYDDLVSCGVLGMMDAIERFDPTRSVRFETYAQIRIRGEIIDYMRRQDWAPVHVRTRIKQMEAAYDRVAQRNGGPASDADVAAELGMDLEDMRQTLSDSHFLNLMYLDELLTETPVEDDTLMSDNQIVSDLEKNEFKEILAKEIGRLTEREQMVLSLYYFDELTLREIGKVLSLTESRISQIHSAAILKLRARLSRQYRS